MADEHDTPTPGQQVAALYEQMESQASTAGERLVGSAGFASLLGQLAANAAAITKLGTDAMDLVLRNLRVAGRRDVVRLARQLARTEDKLERVLQEVEDLRDELAAESSGSGRSTASPRTGSRSSNGASARRSRRSNGAAAKRAKDE